MDYSSHECNESDMTDHTGTYVPPDLQALKILQGFSFFFPFPYILIIKPFLQGFFFLLLKIAY